MTPVRHVTAPPLLRSVVLPPPWAALPLLGAAVPPPAWALLMVPGTPLSVAPRIPPLLTIFRMAAITLLLRSMAAVCMPTPMQPAAAARLAVQPLRGAAAALSASVQAFTAAVTAAAVVSGPVTAVTRAGGCCTGCPACWAGRRAASAAARAVSVALTFVTSCCAVARLLVLPAGCRA